MENMFQKKSNLSEQKFIIKEIRKKNNKMSRKDTLKNIIQEYESRQKSFNPHKPSPNKFIKNLEIRMKMYYRDLYK